MKTLNVPNKELPKLKGLALILLGGSELPPGIPAPDKALAESIVLAVWGDQLTEEWVRDGADMAMVHQAVQGGPKKDPEVSRKSLRDQYRNQDGNYGRTWLWRW